jgi:hypothetical protein
LRAAFASAGARPRMLSVRCDDANKQVEKKFTFAGCEHFEDTLLSGQIVFSKLQKQPLTRARELQDARPPILFLYTTFDQPFDRQFLDKNARAVAINPEPSCEPHLVNSGFAVPSIKAPHGAILQRGQPGFSKRSRRHRYRDLIDPPGEPGECPAHWSDAGPQTDSDDLIGTAQRG